MFPPTPGARRPGVLANAPTIAVLLLGPRPSGFALCSGLLATRFAGGGDGPLRPFLGESPVQPAGWYESPPDPDQQDEVERGVEHEDARQADPLRQRAADEGADRHTDLRNPGQRGDRPELGRGGERLPA